MRDNYYFLSFLTFSESAYERGKVEFHFFYHSLLAICNKFEFFRKSLLIAIFFISNFCFKFETSGFRFKIFNSRSDMMSQALKNCTLERNTQ
jgi:hypothetical protein